MPAKIDTNLLPPVILESVDPEILDRAQSIEWSINRDTGENERGFVDGSHEDYLSSQNLMYKSHDGKQIDWLASQQSLSRGGRDSGFEPGLSPGTPSLLGLAGARTTSSTSENLLMDEAAATGYTIGQLESGASKRHPMRGQYPFPIYKVNQEQLQGDVFFERAPKARPGERTIHYEKSSRIFNEEELNALGLDPKTFGPNSNTLVDEQEEETIETSILKANAQELEQLYQSMRNQEAGDYFDRQRARSLSPSGRNRLDKEETSEQRRTVIFGSLEELNDDRTEQEFYPYRDAHQGKPLPGDNEYGTWGSRRDEQRQWKLCNGQWVRMAEPKKPPKPEPAPPKYEQYLAEQVKCKPPKRIQVARAEPVRTVEPERGNSTDDESPLASDSSIASLDLDQPEPVEPLDLDFVDDMPDLAANLKPDSPPPVVRSAPEVDRSPPGERSFSPDDLDDRSRQPKPRRLAPRRVEPEPDIEALKDRYRPKLAQPKPVESKLANAEPSPSPPIEPKKQTGTILLKPPEAPVQIICEPITPTYVEMKKPLKHEGEEEKMMEDPNLMWMGMGPAQYGPPFGTLKKRKAREEEWIGPPCELCHKQIEERRCMLAENRKFHCWHFACSFCLKTLKPADFLIAEVDKKPYCLNCHKREFPEISLVGLHLEE